MICKNEIAKHRKKHLVSIIFRDDCKMNEEMATLMIFQFDSIGKGVSVYEPGLVFIVFQEI